MSTVPLVVLPACRAEKEGQTYHTIGDKYVRAVAEAAGCLPLMVPSLTEHIDPIDLVNRADGIMLTGSPSNVHPDAYGQDAHEKAEPYDTWRDAITLPLIRAAIADGCPLLAICRGMQELNVALGGTLHARLHEQPERMDHRRPQDDDPDVQYGPRHAIDITSEGMLARLLGTARITVNSLHWQGIAEPAPTLAVEAQANDGTIEAISLPGASDFVLGVQWHPEYKATGNANALRIFEAFATAARNRAQKR